MRSLLIGIIFFATIFNLQAQYEFSVYTAPYTPVPNLISLNGKMTFDDPDFTIPFGFNFPYYGKVLDSLHTGLGYGSTLYDPNEQSDSLSFLSPFGADILDRGLDPSTFDPGPGALSTLGYSTTGAIGSRILKIEWRNIGFYGDLDDDGVSEDSANVQCWLYENGIIEMRFGESLITDATRDFDGDIGPWVAIYPYRDTVNHTFGDGIGLFGPPSDPLYDAFLTNYSILDSIPPKNTVYRFTPESTGTRDILAQEQIKLLGNPVNSILAWQPNFNQKIVSLLIYDAQGKVLHRSVPNDAKIDVGNLSPGTYFGRWQTDDGFVIKKFTKM